MVLIPNNENLSASSGVVNMPFLESVYVSFMHEALQDMGRTVMFHLPETVEQDDSETQNLPAPQQYNSFFGGVPVPQSNTRDRGTKITPRDVEYTAHIVIGPLRAEEDTDGIGDLLDNEARLTVVIEALPHVLQARSVSVEGRRYTVKETRPFGLSQRRYIIVLLKEIQQLENGSPDITIG